MISTAEQPETIPSNHSLEADLSHLRHAIHHAAHLLPAQGPITVFIHHNTLHAFEDYPFLEGIRRGGKVFGCTPFLSEERYRRDLERGRISHSDLRAVLEDQLGENRQEKVCCGITRFDLRLAMLQYPIRTASRDELLWCVAETDALRRVSSDVATPIRDRLIAETRRWVMRDLRNNADPTRKPNLRNGHRHLEGISSLLEKFGESSIENWNERTWEAFTLQAMWKLCHLGVSEVPSITPIPERSCRHRALILEATGQDSDLLVHNVLIRFCAAYLDQGFACWELPEREEGFFQSFSSMYRSSSIALDPWLKTLPAELTRIAERKIEPLALIHESLELLGIPESEWDAFLSASFLALRGWGGMIQEVETRGDRVAHRIHQGSLLEFLAVRLLLDRLALASTIQQWPDLAGPLKTLRERALHLVEPIGPPSSEQRAFVVFQLAQALGLPPDGLAKMSKADWVGLMKEIEEFASLERRETFHLAFERRFRNQTLDAISLHSVEPHLPQGNPKFQVICCLDEREESFRRHLEEVAPEAETFGAAGFFSVAMYFRGAGDAHFTPLCPIVIRPQHWVTEQVVESLESTNRRRAQTRRVIGNAAHQFHLGSRSFTFGAVLSAGIGVLASIPLVARILFPRLAGKVRRSLSSYVQTPPLTRLRIERSETTAGDHNGQVGYSLAEMVNIGERLLRDIGLTSHFARLVFSLGHGSNSLNNPHKSAYDCGACGGSPGAPNGRALAQILNDPRVREALAQRDLKIPTDTIFVGGFHNTCDDTVTLFDVDRLPDTHRTELNKAVEALQVTCERNAHERCRRFMSAPLTLSISSARQHVEGRSEDLAQTRPELGHATNAICFVGRRSRTRGLYLDRRAFLVSYDCTQDDHEAGILARTLGAVFPVCSGINLEYFFSHVDSAGWGCGTKLPHNITSLLGVMDGAESDLRTGLPWQMVEIHEPLRLLFIIETTPDLFFSIMARNAGIDKLVRNGWVQVALLEADTNRLRLFRNGQFEEYTPEADELPQAATSQDWYRGWRDHLEFAQIGR